MSNFPVRPRRAPLGSQQPGGGGGGRRWAGTSGSVSGSRCCVWLIPWKEERLTAPGTWALVRQGEKKIGSLSSPFPAGLLREELQSPCSPDSRREGE